MREERRFVQRLIDVSRELCDVDVPGRLDYLKAALRCRTKLYIYIYIYSVLIFIYNMDDVDVPGRLDYLKAAIRCHT